jgi:phytoene dehydrogenase-like protein
LADAIGPIVEAAGGLLLANRRVTRIIVENGRAVGVDVAHRRGGREEAERYRAPVIVSDAGAYATYGELLPRELARRRLDAIEALGPSPSAVSLFLGLNESPQTLGFHGENHWIYESYDHDRVFAGEGVVDGRPEQC